MPRMVSMTQPSDSNMPISSDNICSQLELANTLALSGSEQDREQAKAFFLDILTIVPDHLDAWVNLGILLFETGYTLAAITAFTAAVNYHPQCATAHAYLGNALLYRDELAAAKEHFDVALSLDPGMTEAHRGLSSIYRRQGNHEESTRHRHLGFRDHAVSILPAYAKTEPVQLLVLASADEGNIPWRLLIDRSMFNTTIIAVEYFDSQLPFHHLVFNAIGDADLCREALEKSIDLLKTSQTPVINNPETVLNTGRIVNASRLAALPGVRSSRMHLIAKADFYAKQEILSQYAYPFLMRSPGFHGGNHFARITNSDDLQSAFKELPGENLLLIEYLDSHSSDKLFRKYRIMFINGLLYPIHMAISENWNVHYFSSEMEENEAYRSEEASFLCDFKGHLGETVITALMRISLALELDYCGIDFGIDGNDKLLLYEANPTMLINPPTHEKKWDYRREAASSALSATRNMFLKRAALSKRSV